MTTSGTATFNANRDLIIKMALRKVGAIASGETPDYNTIQDASDQLNVLIKALDATGLHIWTEEEATLFLNRGQVSYTIGTGTTDHATGSYNSTTLTAAAALNATTLTVASIVGILNGDKIGVILDHGGIFWTTVNGAPSGSTVTLTAGLTDSAAATNPVFNYTTDIGRPLRVVAGRRFNYASAIDTPMIPLARLDYRALPNKTTPGVVTQFFYDPRGGANTQGIIYVWPSPADSSNALKFTWYRPMQDFTSSANTPDLPNEWIQALVWNLAFQMAPEYDCNPQRFEMIKEFAAGSLDAVAGWDREIESYLFGFNTDQTGP